MHRKLVLAATIAGVSACATAQPTTSGAVRPVGCSEGFAPLRFAPGADAPDPIFAEAADWIAETATQCGVVILTVRGLADPSEDSLAGRGAAQVARALWSVGAPTPAFVPGTQYDREHPSLEVDARP